MFNTIFTSEQESFLTWIMIGIKINPDQNLLVKFDSVDAHDDFIDEVIEHVVPIVELTATDSTAGEFHTPLEILNITPKSTTTTTTIFFLLVSLKCNNI